MAMVILTHFGVKIYPSVFWLFENCRSMGPKASAMYDAFGSIFMDTSGMYYQLKGSVEPLVWEGWKFYDLVLKTHDSEHFGCNVA